MTDPSQVHVPRRLASEEPAPTLQPDGREWLRQLDWRQFEQLVAAAYRLQGYDVLTTSPGADGGIDLILTRGGDRIFVQCKHWKAWQVGAPVIRELFGLVVANRASRGIVVTSGRFSREAIEFARQTGTDLVDGPALMALVASGKAQLPVTSPMPAGFPSASPQLAVPHPSLHFATPVAAPGVPSCPVCLAPMLLQKARRGRNAGSMFWGCSRFPGCRGTREAAPHLQPPRAARPRASQPAATPRQPSGRRSRTAAALVAGTAVVVGALLLMLLVPAVIRAAVRPGAAAPPVRLIPSAPTVAPSTAGEVPSAGPSMGEQPMDLVVDSTSSQLYTANYVSGDVTVIDARSMAVVGRIDAQGKPTAITMSGKTLYVADRASRKVYAIDTLTGKATSTFATGKGPSDLAIDMKGDRLFIANGDGRSIWAYALSSGRRVGTIALGLEPAGIAVDVEEHKLYVAASPGVLITYRTGSLGRLETTYAGTAGGLAVDSKRQRLYSVDSAGVRERNLLSGTSHYIATRIKARAVTVDVRSQVAYVVDPDTGAIEAVNLK